MQKSNFNINDYISPLNINGLEGRVMRLPAPSGRNRQILFVYGQHSSLERWSGLARELNRYGEVLMPDLPGLGGMTSLYKIGQIPTIDNMADYLAAFIKLKYKNKKITLVGMSLGFAIVTRMLQRCPELVGKVDLLVSVVGFAKGDDFLLPKRTIGIFRVISFIFSGRIASHLFRVLILNKWILRFFYHRTARAKEKFADVSSKQQFNKIMNMEVVLWQINDIRTQMKHYREMFNLDNTKKRIDLPVYHVYAKNDRYFDNLCVEQHYRMMFNDFIPLETTAPSHAPTIVADPKDAAPFIPKALRRILLKPSH